MRELILSPRLMAVAELVGKREVIADIGTDHAYLPTYLILNGLASKAYCSDIRKGPLNSAERTVKSFGADKNTELFLSDGLEEYEKRGIKPDVFIVAGMGGIEIASILKKAECYPDTSFILQPMNNIEYLRKQLFEGSFEVLTEKAVCEGEKVYIVMHCCHSRKKVGSTAPDDRYVLLGKVDTETQEGKRYLDLQLLKYQKALEGLKKSEKNKDRLLETERKLSVLKKAAGGKDNEA